MYLQRSTHCQVRVPSAKMRPPPDQTDPGLKPDKNTTLITRQSAWQQDDVTYRTHPDDNTVGHLRRDDVSFAITGVMRAQRNDKHEVALVGVGLAFLAHVVGGGLGEVQPTHRDLVHLITRKVNANRMERLFTAI